MAERILMPQGGQDLKFGQIVQWLKKEGDRVRKDELICEVETEKAVFEVTAPREGILLKIIKADGEEAEVLSTIGYIGNEGEHILHETEITSSKAVDKKRLPSTRESAHTTDSSSRKIAPRARKLALEHDIDLTTLNSSRADGKISSVDVEQAIAERNRLRPKSSITGGRLVQMNKIERTASKRLTDSWSQIPHFFVTVSVAMTAALKVREAFNDKAKDVHISINDMVIRAVANALRTFPRINSSYHDENTIIEWEDVNIGIATASERGLLVPVLGNADKLSIREIAKRVKTITTAARDGKQVSELPSHFTISNLGMYKIERFSAIINPPEAAILAIASVKKKPVCRGNEEIVVRDMMEMTLSLDHRIGDGSLAAQYLNTVKDILENPQSKNLFA